MSADTLTRTKFTLAPLPYGYAALAPEISEETLRYHHDKHAAGYVAKLGELVRCTPYETMDLKEIILKSDGAIYNNAAQIWNHEFYFGSLSPDPQPAPQGALLMAINEAFGSTEKLWEHLSSASASLFGSGYVWLSEEPTGKLAVYSGQNADNPMRLGYRPLFCIDLWEHAYYIDYRNLRAESVNAFRKRLDWGIVEKRYAKKQ